MQPEVALDRIPASLSASTPLAHLEAHLPRDMVVQSLRDLSPLRIHLAEPAENRRWIELDPPAEVHFEEGKGIRVVTTGRFRFDLVKVPIAAHLDRIEFLISPRIVSINGRSAAAIPIEIINADVRMIPDLVDDFIVAQVNRALTPRASQLVWRLSDTLSAVFAMPDRLGYLEALELSVEGSYFEVTEDALRLRVAYQLGVNRNDDA